MLELVAGFFSFGCQACVCASVGGQGRRRGKCVGVAMAWQRGTCLAASSCSPNPCCPHATARSAGQPHARPWRRCWRRARCTRAPPMAVPVAVLRRQVPRSAALGTVGHVSLAQWPPPTPPICTHAHRNLVPPLLDCVQALLGRRACRQPRSRRSGCWPATGEDGGPGSWRAPWSDVGARLYV